MFRSVWLKTIRDHRIAVLGWSIGLGLLLYALYATAEQVLRGGVAEIYQSFRFYADPVAIDTVPGYITFRGTSVLIPTVLAIWVLLTGARLLRGEEERGSMDVLLSYPLGRVRLLLEKLIGVAVSILLICLILAGFAMLGQASAHEAVDYGRALGAMLNVGLFELCVLLVACLLSHFLRTAGAAAGWTGGVLLVMFMLDAVGRTVEGAGWLRNLSLYHYYNANKPLIPSVPADWAALAVLGVALLALLVINAWVFARRDLGGVVLDLSAGGQREEKPLELLEEAWGSLWLRSLGWRTLRARSLAILAWTVGICGGYAGLLTWMLPRLLDVFRRVVGEGGVLGELFSGQDISTNQGVISAALFGFIPVLVSFYALTLAASWSRDLDNGRMEIVLSTPQPRSRLLLEHAAAVILAAIFLPVVLWLAILLAACAVDLRVDVARLAAASAAIFPLELIAAGLVYLLACRLPSGAATGLASAFLLVSFLGEFLRPVVNMPDWLIGLSIFHQYGTPAVTGMEWGRFLALLAVGVALLVAAVVAFGRTSLAARS